MDDTGNCITCTRCGLLYCNGDQDDVKYHNTYCNYYISAVIELDYTPNWARQRANLKDEAHSILCSSKDDAFILTEQVDAALLLIRQHFDRSLEAAIIHEYYKQHPTFERYVAMVLNSYSQLDQVLIKQLQFLYGVIKDQIAPGYSFWFPPESIERKRQFRDAGVPLPTPSSRRPYKRRPKKARRNRSCQTSKHWIYSGFDSKASKFYVGQTTRVPEYRWALHRKAGTGAFAENASDAEWQVLDRVVQVSLNSREAYFIGYYDSYEHGFNETRGNDLKSYKKGQAARERDLADNTHPSLNLTKGLS